MTSGRKLESSREGSIQHGTIRWAQFNKEQYLITWNDRLELAAGAL